MWVESDYANNEEDSKWIRSICFEQFFKINVFEDDNAIFRQKTAPYKRDSTNGAKRLAVGKADFSNIPVLQVRLRRALKKKIWLTHRPRSDSAAMEEFFQNLEVDYIDKDEMVENYFNYLWTMHRVVTIFDLVKASALENFTGTSRTFLEGTKTWNNFIMAVRHESDTMATDTFKNEYYPAVLDEEIFDRNFANAESDFEKSIVVSDRLEGINKYHNEFEKAYGKDYLMYFLMNEQYLDILSILRNFQEMNYDASRDKVLSSLLVPREPAELIREGNGDGGLGFYKKLLAYQHTFTKIAVKSDSRNIPVELPETLSAQLSLLQKTKLEVPDKLLKNSDRDVIKGHIEKNLTSSSIKRISNSI